MVRLQEVQTESVLRRRFEVRLAALVRQASDVVSLLDGAGRVTYVSPSASRLLGRPESSIVGRRWDELVHPDDAAAIERFLDGLATGQSAGVDHRLARVDGSWLDVETLATNLLGDDTVDAIVLNTRDVSQRKELERRLAHQATHDALTSLPGRTLLVDRIDLALARRRREGRRLAVLFVDLDDFKALNDTMGHAAGDWALQEVAARLQSSLRATDSAARLGGDEFALLLDGIAGPDEAIAVADRCLAALAEPLLLDGREFAATASIGIALDADETHTSEDMLRRADAAMYDAKRSGKSCHAVFDSARQSIRADRPIAH
jgi:diguanylate cyclase (GGDEF)-like protein/PAS domain S-box-containing protein